MSEPLSCISRHGCMRAEACVDFCKGNQPEQQSEETFAAMPSLYTEDLYCWLVKEGRLAALSTPHEGGGATIFVTVAEARLIRDWLNRVLV